MPVTQPGQRLGGREAGTPNKVITQALIRAEQQLLRAKAEDRSLAVDILDEFMHRFARAARARQPRLDEDRKDTNPLGNQEDYEKYARLAVDTAAQLAKYQSPTFRAITVAPPPPAPKNGPERKRFSLTIFDTSGRKTVAHVTPIAAQGANGHAPAEPITIDAEPTEEPSP